MSAFGDPCPAVRPELTEAQVGALAGRLDYYWREPGRGGVDLTADQMAAVLHALFPHDFAGDEAATLAEIRRLREGERRGADGRRLAADPVADAEFAARSRSRRGQPY